MEENYKLFSSYAYSFYIRANKQMLNSFEDVNSLSKIAFEERDKILKKTCKYVIEIKNDNIEEIANAIINKLKEVVL